MLPRCKFVDVTESDLERYKSDDMVYDKNRSEPEVLIADNSYIGPLIYNKKLPFKFIQVSLNTNSLLEGKKFR